MPFVNIMYYYLLLCTVIDDDVRVVAYPKRRVISICEENSLVQVCMQNYNRYLQLSTICLIEYAF